MKLVWGAGVIALGASVVLYSLRYTSRGISPNAANRSLAPDFTLPRPDGQDLRLSSYRGKVVLLDFWATWCYPCREEIPHLVDLQQKYGDRGLQIIGVSLDDSPDPVPPFYQQFHMNYPVVMGTAKTGELYGGRFRIARCLSHRPRWSYFCQAHRRDRRRRLRERN